MTTASRTQGVRPCLALALALLAAAAPAAAQSRVAPIPPVGTSFDPLLDGMPFGNFGDATSPEGNCFGMSLLAIDNYLLRMERRAAGLPDPPAAKITVNPQDGHVPAQILASLAQLEAERRDEQEQNPEQPHPLRDAAPIRAALERIMRTGQPEVLGMYAKDGGHATVLHGYDGSNLLVYDPNYPGETLRWPWSPTHGLGKHPRSHDDALYRTLQTVASTPFEKFRTSRELAALRAACAAGEQRCLARFPRLESGLVEENGKLFAVGQVALEGPDGNHDAAWREQPQRPSRAWVTLDGRPFAQGRIDEQGRFKVTLPPRLPAGELHVVAVTAHSEGLAGYGRLPREVTKAAPTERKSAGFLGRLR